MKLSAPNITDAEQQAALQQLRAGQLDPGPAAEEFACALADFWCVPRSWILLTNSCTQAMALGRALYDDKRLWLAPALTWPGTYCQCGGRVKLVDVGSLTGMHYNTEIGVNLYGRIDVLHEFKSTLLIDSAHCVKPKGLREAVETGAGVCFSFGPTKEITTIRGGALVHKDAQKMEQRLRCNTVGRVPQPGWGVNGTITEVGAAMGLEQLKRHDKAMRWRQSILSYYDYAVHHYAHMALVTRPELYSGHLAVLRFKEPWMRERAAAAFAASAVPTSIHYLLPEDSSARWPNAHAWSQTVLSIPCHAQLSKEDCEIVCKVIDRVGYLTRPGKAELSDKG